MAAKGASYGAIEKVGSEPHWSIAACAAALTAPNDLQSIDLIFGTIFSPLPEPETAILDR